MTARKATDIFVEELLKFAIEREGLRGFARRAGVSAPFVARVRDGQSAPGPKLLRALGWERVVMYRKVDSRAAETCRCGHSTAEHVDTSVGMPCILCDCPNRESGPTV